MTLLPALAISLIVTVTNLVWYINTDTDTNFITKTKISLTLLTCMCVVIIDHN